ncbi:MAG: tetratricopeptide repeat protein [Cyanobacteria bacterium P01_H01_bin.105]
MSQPKRLSRQELIRQRQSSSFVGRVKQLEAFQHNLTNLNIGPDGIAYPTAFLFNIWGQGGVGKSSLLRKFEDIAKQQKHLVARIDEGITTVPEAMATFAKHFAAQGQPLTKFDERYKVYRQRREELETDPEAPQGFSAFVGETAAKVGLKLSRKIPMGDVAMDFVDEASVIEGAGEWATYITRKLKGDEDEIQLVNKPIEVLTSLFLKDLSNITSRQVVLQFDTYERTREILDLWLLDILKDRYGILPSNCIWVIAGRDQLGVNSWSGYEPVLFPLESFSVEEATQFLQRRGVTNAEVIETILDVSGRLPLLLAILAESSPNDPTQVGEASGTAVERFLQWVDDPRKRQLALDAALPQSLNQDVVAQLVSDVNASVDDLFIWLKGMPFVRDRSDGWAYHDVVRPQMLRFQHRESNSRWETKHKLLAEHYQKRREDLKLDKKTRYGDEDWQDYTLKYLYHQLCRKPQEQLTIALNSFLDALKQKRSFAQQYSEAILRVGDDTENRVVKRWGKQLTYGLKAYGKGDYQVTIKAFTALLNSSRIDQTKKAIVLAWRGKVYRRIENYDKALTDFTQATELDPNYQWAIAHRGETHRLVEHYDEAIADFTRAIELDPNYQWAIAHRGRTYRLMEHFDEAIVDFTRAIELDPNYQWAITNRGVTYKVLTHYDEAIVDFTRAIELDPNYQWAIAMRGTTYCLMELYDMAIKDFTQAIELNPNYQRAIASRGVTYCLMEQHDSALADLNRAIEINPKDKKNIIGRGNVYLFSRKYHQALTDFATAAGTEDDNWSYHLSKAFAHLGLKQLKEFNSAIRESIRLATQNHQKFPENHHNTFNLALCYLVAQRIEKAKQLYKEVLSKKVSIHQIKHAVRDLKLLLTIFPTYPNVREMEGFLQSAISLYQIKLDIPET